MPPDTHPWRSAQCHWLHTGVAHGYKMVVGDLPATILEAADLLKRACIQLVLLEWVCLRAALRWRCLRLTHREVRQARWSFRQHLGCTGRLWSGTRGGLTVQWSHATPFAPSRSPSVSACARAPSCTLRPALSVGASAVVRRMRIGQCSVRPCAAHEGKANVVALCSGTLGAAHLLLGTAFLARLSQQRHLSL